MCTYRQHRSRACLVEKESHAPCGPSGGRPGMRFRMGPSCLSVACTKVGAFLHHCRLPFHLLILVVYLPLSILQVLRYCFCYYLYCRWKRIGDRVYHCWKCERAGCYSCYWTTPSWYHYGQSCVGTPVRYRQLDETETLGRKADKYSPSNSWRGHARTPQYPLKTHNQSRTSPHERSRTRQIPQPVKSPCVLLPIMHASPVHTLIPTST